jgi:integrase
LRRGYWAEHPYERRSVSEAVEGFIGWSAILTLIKTPERPRDRAFLAALFETGGRVSEVLSLRRENFELRHEEDVILVRRMPLLKRYRKVGPRETMRLRAYRRTFPIPLSEPPAKILAEWIEASGGLLFPSPIRYGRPLTRKWAYKLIAKTAEETGIPCWPHWFRAQRACQLVEEYGFEVIDLVDWFCWQKPETALEYARRGWKGLLVKMSGARLKELSGFTKV